MPTLKKSGIAEHRRRRGEAAAGVAPDAGAREVDVGILLRQLLHAGDLIGDRVVAAHRAVVRILERLRAARRAHAVDRDDDEAQFGERLPVAARGGERAAAGAARLRAWIHVVDDRILLRRIEIRRHEHQAVDVGLAVVRLHLDRDRRLPARRQQLRDVGLLERHDQACRRRSRSTTTGGVSGCRVGVDQILPGGRELDVCVPSSGVSDTAASAIEA